MEKAKYLQFGETDFLTENIHGQTNCAKRRVLFPPPPVIFHSRVLQVTSKPMLVATCKQQANGNGLWAESIAQLAVTTVLCKPTGRRLQPTNLAPGDAPQRWNSQPSGQTSLQAVYLCYRGVRSPTSLVKLNMCKAGVAISNYTPWEGLTWPNISST